MSMDLQDKKVIVIGLGLTGQSCIRFLQQQGASVSAMDSRHELIVSMDIPIYLGEFDQDKLMQAELVVVSPGVNPNQPAIQACVAAGVEVIGDVELFARFNRAPVIAITGSNGKSTVTSLVAHILQKAGKTVAMGGNIGTPALDLLAEKTEFVVLELSSFQLEMTSSLHPASATILNISDDHLDRHITMHAYWRAKQKVYSGCAHVVANRDDHLTLPDLEEEEKAVDCLFGLSQSDQGFSWDAEKGAILLDGKVFVKANTCALAGLHNVMNIQAAAALVMAVGIKPAQIKKAIVDFEGLPHRCQLVSQFAGKQWINDSKATNVGATLAALQGLAPQKQGKLVLIAGGEGKGADFSSLRQAFNHDVDLLITLGKDGKQLAILKDGAVEVKTLQQAVAYAHAHTQEGDMILLSPACASLDMFKNYQHRGEEFSKAIVGLSS